MKAMSIGTMKSAVLSACAVFPGLFPSQARAQFDVTTEISVSTTARKMFDDLQDLSKLQRSPDGSYRLNEFFDQSARVRAPQPVAVDPRGRPIIASRLPLPDNHPVTNNPAVKLWLSQNPRLAYDGQGNYRLWPPPPRIYAYAPNPFPYDNRGYGVPYPAPGDPRAPYNSYLNPGYGRSPYTSYNPYVPYAPGAPYSPAPSPYIPRPPVGEPVNGFQQFLNSVQTWFDNTRYSIGQWLEPQSPYVTRHAYVPDAYGRNVDIPTYRYTPGPIDIPGYGFPAYGFGPYGSGGGYGPSNGYGYAPEFGSMDGDRFAPGQGLTP